MSAPLNNDQSYQLGWLKKRSEFLHVRNGHYAARKTVVIQSRKAACTGPSRDAATAHISQNTKAGKKTKTKMGKHYDMRVGITATKRIGNAVIRNRAKRRLRALARDCLPRFGQLGYDYVLIARDHTPHCEFSELKRDIEKALKRLAQGHSQDAQI